MELRSNLSLHSFNDLSTTAMRHNRSPNLTPKRKIKDQKQESTNISKAKPGEIHYESIQKCYTPMDQSKRKTDFLSPKTQRTGDRFIPNRHSHISKQLFNLPESILASPSDVSDCNEKQQNSLIYNNILEQKLLNIGSDRRNVNNLTPNDEFFTQFEPSMYKRVRKFSGGNDITTPVSVGHSLGNIVIKRPRILDFSDKKKRKFSLDDDIDDFFENGDFDTGIKETKLLRNIRNMRKISKTPYKVLDAPGLQDDFYQDILDWSKKNVISIALASTLYFWSSNDSEANVLKISELDDGEIYCALKWSPNGQMLAAGSDTGMLEVFDTKNMTRLNSQNPHLNRISSMSWLDDNIFSTGSRDNLIKTHDVRQMKAISTLNKHSQEVCGLKWSPNGVYLASGGNDNLIHIWDYRKSDLPILTFNQHKAAVRALCWSPHQYGLLLSGGGNVDKSLKFWNVTTGILTHSIDTDSQICNLALSHHSNEIVTTHGFSGNQIMVWNANTYERISVLEGHVSRVLHLALSPDSEKIATAAADETLKFWKVFPKEDESPQKSDLFSMLELR